MPVDLFIASFFNGGAMHMINFHKSALVTGNSYKFLCFRNNFSFEWSGVQYGVSDKLCDSYILLKGACTYE